MKRILYFIVITITVVIITNKTFAQNANTSLSNLTSPTKVNTDLSPDSANKRNLGSSSKSWKNIYIKR